MSALEYANLLIAVLPAFKHVVDSNTEVESLRSSGNELSDGATDNGNFWAFLRFELSILQLRLQLWLERPPQTVNGALGTFENILELLDNLVDDEAVSDSDNVSNTLRDPNDEAQAAQ